MVAVVSVISAGCNLPFGDPAPIPDLGVRLSSNGAVEAAFRPCSIGPLSVAEISLFRFGGKVGRSNDQLLWRVRAEPPVIVEDFVLAADLDGFRTETNLASLPPKADLILELKAGRYGYTTSVGFSLAELKTNDYLVAGAKKGYVSPEKFNQRSHCR